MTEKLDPREAHKRYLDYRERHGYFGAGLKLPVLSAEAFATADVEHTRLEARGESRDDEEEARFNELVKLLFRD
ncbi:MAG: hypothetical protein IPG50_01115 [Myxococcales bacterium]|nr:hypothetical protein [Myxococcales bacterium]